MNVNGKSISAPEHAGKDFWWPEMEVSNPALCEHSDKGVTAIFQQAHLTLSKTDSKGHPDVEQIYSVPQSYITHVSFAERGVYSMWSHFCGYCSEDPAFQQSIPMNTVINTERLPFFRTLAEGRSLMPELPPLELAPTCWEAASALRKNSFESEASIDEYAPEPVPIGQQSPNTVAADELFLSGLAGAGIAQRSPGRKMLRPEDINSSEAF